MKLARCVMGGAPYWAVVDPDQDLATPLRGSLDEWAVSLSRGEAGAALDASRRHALSAARVLAPVEPTAKIVCVGLNYRKHVEAFGGTMPDEPVAFLKAQTAIIAHEEVLVRPALTQKLDYEIELVAVMARPLREGEPPSAAILGYTIGNDVSARDLQRGPRGPDLYSGKSLNGTSGVGPWIVTADEFLGSPDLAMELRVNGEVRQSDRTSSMEWGLDALLTYVDARTRVLAGDLMFTGTPAGVALEDGRFLVPGDLIEAQIERLGVLRNRVAAPAASAAARAPAAATP
jgi:2-keto-4-pentenoate hydratase/2-oxohepta-3-ene-1,7-dioic acid hydratase in catechol pathway